jgi:outer membrane protein assembly factor BamA
VGGEAGVLRQSLIEPVPQRFLRGDAFIDADTRDLAGYPSAGGHYTASLAGYHDATSGLHSFRRLEADGAQYVPLPRHAVFAVAGRVALSQTAAGQSVPFHLLPAIGGLDTLRGYANYRFRDRNIAMLSAEYRWPVMRALDAAIFYDAGTVASTATGLGRAQLARDAGIGFRFHSATRNVLRLDVARGSEGIGAVISFSAPLRGARRAAEPYVP